VSLQRVPVRVLLVSRENAIVEALRRAMEQASMIVELCVDRTAAANKLERLQCEAIVLDFRDKESSRDLLAVIRATKFHRRMIAMAILDSDNDVEEAFRAGANFVFERPLFPGIVARTLRAAYPLMLQERRSHFRCPIQLKVTITSESLPEFLAAGVNISEGGICVQTDVALRPGTKIRLLLTLPWMSAPIGLSGEVRWHDGGRYVGIQFLHLPPAVLRDLQQWLAVNLQHFFFDDRQWATNQIH